MMKRKPAAWTGIVLSVCLILSFAAAASAEAADASYSTATEVTEADASYYLDADNVQYVLVGDAYVPCAVSISGGSGSTVQPMTTGFGEDSASWRYSKTDNGYTVKHKGWKERQSSSSLYGVRACSTTVCSPVKQFWTSASMTKALGYAYTTGTTYGTGGPLTAKSDYYNVHIENACMRSTWGGVGTVISQW